jgi:MYXO-CTERM domain-containing protein
MDLNFEDRVFDVEGTLNIGSEAAPIEVTNGGIIKEGTGILSLNQSMTLDSLTINEGTVRLAEGPVPAPAAPDDSESNSTADGTVDPSSLQAVPEPNLLSFLAAGLLAVFARRRRASRV